MVTDEQLIERLRSSMQAATADVLPRPELLDGIATPREGRFWRPSLGGAAALLATAVALGVVAVAIVLLGHGRTPAPPSVAPPAARPTNNLAGLRSELGILRERQRPADRMPQWGIAAEQRQRCSNCLNVGKVIRRETRLLTTVSLPRSDVADGRRERIYLVLGTVPPESQNTFASGWRQHGKSAHGVHLSLVGLTSRRAVMAQPTDELLNYSSLAMPAAALTPRDVMITISVTVGVVPDGVARVKWELANPGQKRAATVYPRIRGNVALAPWTPAPRSTSLINEQWLVGATWYDAQGRVLASFHQSLARLDRGASK